MYDGACARCCCTWPTEDAGAGTSSARALSLLAVALVCLDSAAAARGCFAACAALYTSTSTAYGVSSLASGAETLARHGARHSRVHARATYLVLRCEGGRAAYARLPIASCAGAGTCTCAVAVQQRLSLTARVRDTCGNGAALECSREEWGERVSVCGPTQTPVTSKKWMRTREFL